MGIGDLIATVQPTTRREWLNREGTHLLALKKFGDEELYNGRKAVATFEVVESDSYAPGTEVSYSWGIYEGMQNFRKMAMADCRTFINAITGQTLTDSQVPGEVEKVENGGYNDRLVQAKGVRKPARPKKDNPEELTKPFVAVYFNAVPDQKTATPASVLAQLK